MSGIIQTKVIQDTAARELRLPVRQVPSTLFTNQPRCGQHRHRAVRAPRASSASRDPRQGSPEPGPSYSATPIFVKFEFAFQLDLQAEDLSLKKMLKKTSPFYLNTNLACI